MEETEQGLEERVPMKSQDDWEAGAKIIKLRERERERERGQIVDMQNKRL